MLLEADPIELAGEGGSPLASHVRECERCRATAATLLEGQAELAMALEGTRPRIVVEEAIAAARAQQSRMARRRAAWRWLPPIAAAAVLAGLLVLRPFELGRNGELGPTYTSRHVQPLVEAPAGKDVMVFKTKDPSITVIWFYPTQTDRSVQ